MGFAVRADDGCGLWAVATGVGDPVVCCHGGPGLWDMFDAVALPGRVVRWDQRGGGRSQRRGPFTTARFVADLDDVRAHFGFAATALLGHSWGADLALRHALAHPHRVTGLVYLAGVGLSPGWHAEFTANFRARLGDDLAAWTRLRERERTEDEERELAVLQWTADFADRDRARAHAETMATPWFPINYEVNAAVGRDGDQADLLAACADLAVPVLVVDGRHDIRPRWAVDSLVEALPNATRVTLDTGHVPWLGRPEEFTEVVGGFLEDLGSGADAGPEG
ncbi:alpha/beta hydrolase [Actinokineospora sp. PR83]|uniref:alpha/beta fold hydrolase n=1 Tax=Actinokineospora sp. PR83 TaxID=2884908 RepID=UPI001F47142E|nr:alpha/beta hydrolase [Actinokineospora sp. PR83]MCG8918443.1 alpha/beta hydrolase [Actinokineospora sp. PR83]